MKILLDSLKSYFRDNSRDQIEKDWEELKEYDKIGPRVDEFIEQCKLFYELESKDSYWEYSCSNQIIENPKFASDFFLNLVSYN